MNLKCALVPICAHLLFGCSIPQPVSTGKVISPLEMECSAGSAERAEKFGAKYGSFFSGGSLQELSLGFQILAKVPDKYLEFIFTEHQMPVIMYQGGAGATQLTYTERPGGGYPSRMDIGVATDAFAENFLHELGHATDTLLERLFPKYYEELSEVYNQAIAYERNGMWDYAASERDEYFAQGFSAYYCSKETRSRLKSDFPRTATFLGKYLIEVDQSASEE